MTYRNTAALGMSLNLLLFFTGCNVKKSLSFPEILKEKESEIQSEFDTYTDELIIYVT